MHSDDMRCEIFEKKHMPFMGPVIRELGLSEARLEAFLQKPENIAFIAWDGDAIAGFIYGYALDSLDSAPQFFIYSVDVLSEYQNRGIGSRLFQFVVDYAKNGGYSECFVITDMGNKRACRVYEKAGGKNDYEDEIVYVIPFAK